MALPTVPTQRLQWMISAASTANISFPTGAKQNTGWASEEKPAFETFNGIHLNVSEWLAVVDDLVDYLDSENSWIDADKIANSAISTNKIRGSAVTTAKLADANVSSAKLKTTTVETWQAIGAATTYDLAGGAYIFQPQIGPKGDLISLVTLGTIEINADNTATTTSRIKFDTTHTSCYSSCAFSYTYVTSSGEDGWLYTLRDKDTKENISVYVSDDPAGFGSGNFEKIEHPFASYDENTQEIVVTYLEKTNWLDVKMKAYDEGKSRLKAFYELYEIDESAEIDYPDKEFNMNAGCDDWQLVQHDKEKYGKPKKMKINKPDYIKCYKAKRRSE